MLDLPPLRLNETETEALARWVRDQMVEAPTTFDASRALARRLGAIPEGVTTRFAFWTPELLDHRIPAGDVFLELLEPMEPVALTRARQRVRFRRTYLPMERVEDVCVAAVDGVRAGSREQLGHFYAMAWRDREGLWHRILDPMAASLPFGPMAPAEVYDLAEMQANRADRGWWESLAGPQPHKFGPVSNILQIHVPTATAGGTLASLAREFDRLSERLKRELPPEPGDELFLGYDAVQLLPVEPTTVYEMGPEFWTESNQGPDEVTVELLHPDTTNWGYDVVIAGMAAVNPAILETGRPDELVDLAASLHNFSAGPIRLILDVVFGHADNQGLRALNPHFFAGPNMYGQNLDYRNPRVRAILLEMQRRKVDFGADGVRVDGAQDFRWWDPALEQMIHDDEYLQLMSDVEQEVAGTRYRPWFIFEDGRPWPQEDWELASDYRAVIEGQTDGDVFQWGPLTFAHNTPFLYGFWLSKYWRIKEMLSVGAHWISGTANHDTLRRGTQVNPKLNINTRLGDTQMEILEKAYDNPAVALLTYVAFPGVPMDFLNATARANWGFIRNQDDRYGVKVVAEEAISLKWQVDEYSYSRPNFFRRLKEMGFGTRGELARFLEFLPALVEVTDYDLDEIARLLNAVEPELAGPERFSPRVLKDIARAWMDDMHDYCNVSQALSQLDAGHVGFMRSVREFRRAHPWLSENYAPVDHFDYLQPIRGRTVFVSLRNRPEALGGGQVFCITHMEGGESEEFDPLTLRVPGLEGFGWELALRTPNIGADYLGGPVTLRDSMGLVFTRGL